MAIGDYRVAKTEPVVYDFTCVVKDSVCPNKMKSGEKLTRVSGKTQKSDVNLLRQRFAKRGVILLQNAVHFWNVIW